MSIRYSRTRKSSPEQGGPGLLKRKWLLVNLAISATVLLVAAGIWWFRGGDPQAEGDTPANATGDASGNSDDSGAPPVAAVPEKKLDLVVCRVYTPEPGFSVFIDGHRARKVDGVEPLTTPCEVAVPRGPHLISIARPGFRDAHENVNVKENLQEIDFPAAKKAEGTQSELLAAAYLETKPGAPIPVFETAAGEMFDPYITPDGTLLYFAGKIGGYRGVYYVSRPTAYDRFSGEPKLIEATRGYDLPASPGLSTDNLAIVYTLPKLRTVYAVFRETPVGDFRDKRVVYSRRDSRGTWWSAQAVADGSRAWWLYWQQRTGDRRRSMGVSAAKRRFGGAEPASGGIANALAPLADQKFAEASSADTDWMQGKHPCLSRDGLRQYVFDGKSVQRATRAGFSTPFSAYRTIAEVELTDYAPTANRRSYTITDDEQWLFYESGGKLFMVRLADGPKRGYVASGKSIPQRVLKVAKKTPAKKKMPTAVAKRKTPPEKKVDPRTLPLPYPQFQQEFGKLLKARDYAAARKKLQSALAEARFAKDKNLLEWDREELNHIEAFWKDVDAAVRDMKPDMEFNIGSARVRFAGYKDGVLSARSQTKTVEKPLKEMRATDLIVFVENKFGRKDARRQLRIGAFLHHDAQGSASAAASRFERAGRSGGTILERRAARLLQQARHEIDRDNLAQGLKLAKQLLAEFPKSQAADGAKKLNERAYAQIKWTRLGGRAWREANGTFTAAKVRSNGSFLRSPQQLENFELKLEWKSDVPTGQGGVYFRYPGTGNPLDNAFKIQLSDDFGIPADNFCTGALFKVEAPTANAVRKQGEWNTLQLRVRGEEVTATINGRKVLDTKATSETIPLKGYVALDGVIGGITYRKVLLTELP